nr:hypothetical protein [Tanacetum cinerariifolium]
QDFHPIVDFVEASHIRHTLTFNPTVYVSYIRPFWSTARIETMEEGTKILATIDGKLRIISESSIRRNLKLNDEAGISTSTEPHHTPSPEAQQTSPTTYSLPSLPPVTTKPLATITPSDTPQLRQYTRRDRIAQSLVLPTAADEPTSPLGDGSQGEAYPTVTGLELTALCTSLQRRHTEMASKIEAQELEITNLKARVRLLKDGEGGGIAQSREDAPIKGSVDEGKAAAAKRSTKRGSDDTEKMVNVLTSLDVAKILTNNYAKVLKFQTQQRKPHSRKQHKDFYMSVLRSHTGWKARHFKGMTLEEIKEKFDPVWKKIQDFILIGSKEESERFKRKGLRQLIPVEKVYVEALQVKHLIIDWEVHTEGERSYWKSMRLGGSTASYQFFVDMLKHFDREYLNQLWALVKKSLNIRPATNDKEKELWVELKRLYEPDVKDLLWTHTQILMHAPVEWKLYDTYGVHHVISKDQKIFMLVKKDYPLRKGLAIVMISYKLQVENYSQMANDLILKIYKIANNLR